MASGPCPSLAFSKAISLVLRRACKERKSQWGPLGSWVLTAAPLSRVWVRWALGCWLSGAVLREQYWPGSETGETPPWPPCHPNKQPQDSVV